jgi:DNA-binding winged helix-turn-helix (wHTH) protein
VVLKPVRDEGSRVRVYLCGRPTVECRQRAISEASLGGGQGRLLLAFLGTRRTRPVSRPEVIEALWGSRRPPSVETTLNAVVSKLRSALRRVGVAPPHGVATDLGSYQFVMPDAWIDLEAAKTARSRPVCEDHAGVSVYSQRRNLKGRSACSGHDTTRKRQGQEP